MNRNLILGCIAAAIAVAVAIVLVLEPGREQSGNLAHVTFATDWKAQAEHGGFYQALALGYYEEAGLDVEILQGGPGVNVPQLLGAQSVEFGLGSNSFIPLNNAAAEEGAKVAVASFHNDPAVFVTHPRVGA